MLEERKCHSNIIEALITREKSFPTGLDMEFLGRDLPNVAIPHTDIVHNLAESGGCSIKPVTFHNMIALIEAKFHCSSLSLTLKLKSDEYSGSVDGFTALQRKDHLEDLSKISEPEKLYVYC